MESALQLKLDRILDADARKPFGPGDRSLLNAYTACLSFEELCKAIVVTIGEASAIRLALRRRAVRLLSQDNSVSRQASVVHLVDRLSDLATAKIIDRRFVDAHISALFEYLPISAQKETLERWLTRGTRGAMSRWLKAVKAAPFLFDEDTAISYWRLTRDSDFAYAVASLVAPAVLHTLLTEFVDNCEVGWIVAKAALRAQRIDDETWTRLRDLLPATYLYLSAHTGRDVAEDEAFHLVYSCDGATRGLAIWAVGQMGLLDVLDRVNQVSAEIVQRDIDTWRGVVL